MSLLKRIKISNEIDFIIIKTHYGYDFESGRRKIYYPVKNEVVSEFSEMPALVDGNTVIVGEEIISYLETRASNLLFNDL